MAAVLAFGVGAPIAAQSTVPPIPSQLLGQGDISRTRVGLPPPEPAIFDLSLQAPERSVVPKQIDLIDLKLKRVTVEGATAFSSATVDAVFAPLLGHVIQLAQVRDAAAVLEQLYRAKGYFITRVFVPPQKLDNNTLTVRVVEGYIDAVHVDGLDAASRSTAAAILRSISGKTPIDLHSVERCLLIVNDFPGVTATSVLRPGLRLGASDLYVTLAAPANLVLASVSNTNSRILGPWLYGVSGNLNRPLGLPGLLTASLSASGPAFDATQSASLRYLMGIGHDGLIASLGTVVARAHPGSSLKPLNVRNTVLSVEARLRYPIVRTRAQSLFIEGGLAIDRSTTDILQQQVISDHETVGDIALIYQQNNWLRGSTALSLYLLHGLPVLGANDRTAPRPSVVGFNPNFVRLTYVLQRLQTVTKRVSALLAVQGQYSNTKLLTGDLIAFGGPAIGRGYDPSTITGDRGIGGVMEVRYDLPVNRKWLASAQLYAFGDAAFTTTLPSAVADRSTSQLTSAGIGVRLLNRYGSVDLSGAKAFRKIAGSDMRGDPRVTLTFTANY